MKMKKTGIDSASHNIREDLPFSFFFAFHIIRLRHLSFSSLAMLKNLEGGEP